MSESGPFGFEVGRPGDGKRPQYEPDGNWSLYLPHQCDEWLISSNPDRDEVIAEAKQFRAELDAAITELES